MKRSRISWALAVMTVSGAALAVLWPHARDAGATLAAQDDPPQLSDLQLNSALRNNQIVVAEHIEAALAANDAGLAGSFVDLAREKNISLPSELCQRVSDAVEEENSSSHFAKRFANGLVTGNADDVGSLSGTIAGDLFVFGDIRDVAREGKHLVMGEDTELELVDELGLRCRCSRDSGDQHSGNNHGAKHSHHYRYSRSAFTAHLISRNQLIDFSPNANPPALDPAANGLSAFQRADQRWRLSSRRTTPGFVTQLSCTIRRSPTCGRCP